MYFNISICIPWRISSSNPYLKCQLPNTNWEHPYKKKRLYLCVWNYYVAFTLKMHTLKRLLNSYFNDAINNHKYFLNVENFTSSFILTAANSTTVLTSSRLISCTLLYCLGVCDSVVQKINTIACSQVIDSHPAMSECIIFQRLYEAVWCLQMFSVA